MYLLKDYKIIMKIPKLFLLGIIFFYGNITLYSQSQEIIEIGDYLILGDEIIMYKGEEEHIVIPDNLGITKIGDRAFRSVWHFPNENLKSIVIPEGITIIGSGAFEECYNLTSIILPEGLVSIESYAFSNCRELKNITIPESVTSIGGGAFSLCQSLESITIPANVTSRIDGTMFRLCTSLKNITVDDKNLIYSSSDGILFNKQKTTLIKYPAGRTEQIYIIPSSVTAIGRDAFEHSRLTSIIIHENVNTIENYAFDECSQLMNITINEQNRAYSSSNGILFNKDKTILIMYPPANKNEKTYIIPSTVTVINERAFLGSHNLEYMNIPSRVVSIGQGAFADCINLKTITLSSNTKLGNLPYNTTDNFFRKGIEIIFSED